MEGNLIENEDNAMNKGLANLLIREKLNQNQIPSYINKPYVIIC
jgi:phage terminase large subunit-like protein